MNFETQINAHRPGGHSGIGASNAARWMNCAGSVALVAKCPPLAPSKYAQEGTIAHRVAEILLRGHVEPFELWGLNGVTFEMLIGAIDYETCILSEILKSGGTLEIEKQIHMPSIDIDARGTADAVVLNPGELHIIDYKYGAGVGVEVENNPQLLYYALGAFLSYPLNIVAKIKKINTWIVQPRAIHPAGPVRCAMYSPEELVDFGNKLIAAIAKTKQADAPLCVGAWCRFCPALAVCPLQGKITLASAQNDFRKDGPPPHPATLSPKDIAHVLENKILIEAWLSSVYAWALAHMQSGLSVPGFKLVEGRSARMWTDEKKAAEFLGSAAFVTKLISPAQAEKIVKNLPENLVTRRASGPVIDVADSKKEAYVNFLNIKETQ